MTDHDDPTRDEPTTTPRTVPRRTVLRAAGAAAAGLGVGAFATGSVAARPGKPSFGPEIYADGDPWGTKFATEIPAPTNNRHSYDELYFIVDGTDTPQQLPVAEAAPHETAYNGGRWISLTATVLDAEEYAARSPLTDDSEVHAAVADGVISSFRLGAPEPAGADGPIRPTYFECPLLPVKE